jgi:hypothetical protein
VRSAATFLALGLTAAPARAADEPAWAHVHAFFGRAVAADGDRLAVGAIGADDVAFDGGVVHLYAWSGDAWALTYRLRPPSPAPMAHFGRALALQGDRLLVGATLFGTDTGREGRGSAWLFERGHAGWVHVADWTLADEPGDHGFGEAVALAGDVAAVGGRTLAGGEVHVFEHGATGWRPTARLTGGPGESFGDQIALADGWLLVRAGGGARVATYRRGDAGWSARADLPGAEGSVRALAARGSTALLLDERRDRGGLRALVLARDGGRWSVAQAIPLAPGAEAQRWEPIALTDDRFAVASVTDDPLQRTSVERVHVFARAGDEWVPDGVVDRGAQAWALRENFGGALALSGDRLLVAAPRAGLPAGENSGLVYAFTRGGDGWSEADLLRQDDAMAAPCGCREAPASLIAALLLLRRRRR